MAAYSFLNSPVLAATLLVAPLLAGCPVDDVLRNLNGDGAPTRVQARIEVDSLGAAPDVVDFGEVNAGDSRDAVLLVRSVGTDTLVIEDLVLPASSGFSLVNAQELPPFLAPESVFELTLRYAPLQDETAQATLLIASNDRETPELPVTLRAEGLAPAIDLDPPSFDFGDRELGCVGTLPVSIANVGRAPLVIEAIDFEDLAGAGEFAMESLHGFPLTIEPGAPAIGVNVVYSPTDVQPDTGTLTVLSNDPLRPEATTTQFGTAHLGEWAVDEFQQNGENSTDILFVVDNSGSMGPFQADLATNFSSFIQIVESLEVDYHVGVVSTDVNDGGVLQGTIPYITPNTPDPAGSFSANVNLGSTGSAVEKGFDSAYLALSSPNTDPGGPNDGFLRDEAGLYMIFVSDEQEQSTLLGGGDPAAYVSYFQSLKDNPDRVVLSDITGGLVGGGCADSGSDYVAASVMTGGISESICTSNWISALSSLAWLAQSTPDTFELGATPVEDTIEVRLSGDGINFAPIYVGWEFKPSLNAVQFDLDHVPDNGDIIEIGYSVAGTCED